MEIRELSPDDAAAFVALRLEALLDSPEAFASSHEEERDMSLAAVAERMQPSDTSLVFGMCDGERLVASVGLVREGHLKLAHKAFVWGVYVTPAYRRRGIGRRLMAHALEAAAAMPGLRQVNIGVNAGNRPAIALYEGLGFEAFGLERGYLMLDGELRDEIHMALVLDRRE